MLRFIDNILDRITMYRLVLYVLIAFLVLAAVFGYFHILPFSPLALAYSTITLLVVSVIANWFMAKFMKVPHNVESSYITGLILALIITPPATLFANFGFLVIVAVLAQASKYIVNINKKHLFNPAALAVAVTALTLSKSASWWVGTTAMLVPVLIGGLMLARKVRRMDMSILFGFVAVLTTVALTFSRVSPITTVWTMLAHSPLIFFASIMLTEPLTMPPTQGLQLAYAGLVGVLFSPQIHFGSFYLTPEIALLLGNVFSYLVSPKRRHSLTLVDRKEVGNGVYNFVFAADRPVEFRPGQYLEWTVDPKGADTRGNRRYFTIASSPTEPDVMMGVKLYPDPSTFKRQLFSLKRGQQIVASQLAGDFTLPRNKKEKLAFLSGGIGITPFRSMLKYLLDRNEKRSIVHLYSNKTWDEVAYRDVLTEAEENLGIRTIPTLTDLKKVPPNWNGYKGYINEQMVKNEVPDYKERTFFVSGPHGFVEACKKTLLDLGVARGKIKTDFFPGLV